MDAIVIKDVNKSDDDTFLSTLKKLWVVIIVIFFGGAGIGVLALNVPLHMQDLGATGS